MNLETERTLEIDEYNACSNATRQELYDCLNNTNLQRDQDPDELLYNMETTRAK